MTWQVKGASFLHGCSVAWQFFHMSAQCDQGQLFSVERIPIMLSDLRNHSAFITNAFHVRNKAEYFRIPLLCKHNPLSTLYNELGVSSSKHLMVRHVSDGICDQTE